MSAATTAATSRPVLAHDNNHGLVTLVGQRDGQLSMLPSAVDVLLTFPARLPNSDERELLDAWLVATHGEAGVYIAERRSDDPKVRNQILIFTGKAGSPTHVVHSPTTIPCWLVKRTNGRTRIDIFGTLRDALNSIRNALS